MLPNSTIKAEHETGRYGSAHSGGIAGRRLAVERRTGAPRASVALALSGAREGTGSSGRHRTLRCDHESAGPGPDPERIHFHQPENAVEGSAGRVRKPHCGTGRGDGVLPDDG